MGCADPKKKAECEANCNDSNKKCQTVGKDCLCLPKESFKSTSNKYRILYEQYLNSIYHLDYLFFLIEI